MWSTNLDAQADHARERYATLRADAARWRARRAQRLNQPGAPVPGAQVAGRLLARMGGWLIVTGVRWQRAADARRTQGAATLADLR